jgi:acyl phosphate:glycerol-3-phosphate acyltransferase
VRTLGWAIIGFGCGTLPTPYLMALALRRPDVIAEMRREDSPGDAHFLVTRRISKAAGITTIVADMVKGFVPAIVARGGDESPTTLAVLSVAAVAGHSFAPFLRRAGGRGLTTAAGVSLAIVPRAMVGSGVIAMVGTAARRGGFGTSVGFYLLPVFAIAFGYTAPLVWMCVGIAALIMVRRLEGLGEDRRAGVSVARGVVARLFFDQPKGETPL